MGWRLLLPIAGSAGIIYSLVSVSATNQRSESRASTDAVHSWEVEIQPISFELECQGISGDNKKASFKWIVDLSDEEKERLIKGDEIDKEAEVNLVVEGQKNLWPNTWGGIKVDASRYGKSLSVKSYNLKDSYEGGTGVAGTNSINFSHNNYEEKKFICNWEEIKKSSTNEEKEIYRQGILKGSNGLLATQNHSGLKVKVSLAGDCSRDKENKSECSLKVTTNGTDVDWSKKISTKGILNLK